MSQALVSAIRAIEQKPDDVNAEGLYAFCAECGLPDTEVDALIEQPGFTDLGRVTAALNRLEQPEEATDGEASETSDEADAGSNESDSNDVSES